MSIEVDHLLHAYSLENSYVIVSRNEPNYPLCFNAATKTFTKSDHPYRFTAFNDKRDMDELLKDFPDLVACPCIGRYTLPD